VATIESAARHGTGLYAAFTRPGRNTHSAFTATARTRERATTTDGRTVLDILLLALGLGAFGLMAAYAAACARV
jgi:hypothetical protein